MVEYYGTRPGSRSWPGITTPEPRLLVIQPWDKSAVSAVEKAILASNIGITPMSDGTHLKLPIPELSQERRATLAKQARRSRKRPRSRSGTSAGKETTPRKKAQKDGILTEDEHKKMLEDIQKLTDRYIASVDKELAAKEKELMTV